MTIYVDAQPVSVHDDLAIWYLKDIPEGVRRGYYSSCASSALSKFRTRFYQYHKIAECTPDNGAAMAAVKWDDLRPRSTKPAGGATPEEIHRAWMAGFEAGVASTRTKTKAKALSKPQVLVDRDFEDWE